MVIKNSPWNFWPAPAVALATAKAGTERRRFVLLGAGSRDDALSRVALAPAGDDASRRAGLSACRRVGQAKLVQHRDHAQAADEDGIVEDVGAVGVEAVDLHLQTRGIT